MNLSKEEIKNIANLARLKLREGEINFYTRELSAILSYIGKLNEVKTDKIEPTASVAGLRNVYREDEERKEANIKKGKLVASLMRAVPFIERGFVKVKATLKHDS